MSVLDKVRSRGRMLMVLACFLVDSSTPSAVGTQALPAQAMPKPAFEVSSVKPNNSGGLAGSISIQPGGRLTATNVPLSQLVRYANQLQRFQMETGGRWITTERFDVIAKADGDIPQTPPNTVGPIHLMLQSLLIERFKLVVHHEQRDQAIYALVVARSDGKLGPQLKPSTLNCQTPNSPTQPGRSGCGLRAGAGQFMGGGVTLSQLTGALSSYLQQGVVDRSGLAGSYDLELTFTPDQPGGRGAPADVTAPSLFTAMQEQLGLRLSAQRGPVDVLVIDSAERPRPD